ncbi:hypothetical protein BpHYR1_026138 [Brachionus plicatilis]|uniref:Uncharacterized protein n=1 Tax=Brachionus plicatilis TaxID=10195 RepID=A0A3M7T7S3_BRAPC|nr:hypothetical protein BpHYR1_026138 [Brachionus plicatilis]
MENLKIFRQLIRRAKDRIVGNSNRHSALEKDELVGDWSARVNNSMGTGPELTIAWMVMAGLTSEPIEAEPVHRQHHPSRISAEYVKFKNI